LKNKFDTLIDSYIDNKIGISNMFLSTELADMLAAKLHKLHAQDKLRLAGIGTGGLFNKDKSIRGDKVMWLDRKHEDSVENEFLDLIDEFVLYLNRTCFTCITGYEFHFTFYEIGTFYKKHIDQFKNNDSRQYSMVCYLNEDWKQGDGGELRVFQKDIEDVAPMHRKCVFFKSDELEHEVLKTNKERLSITGWFKINGV
jgi:SM-20-related protein